MLLLLFAFIMRYVDISKAQQSQRCATCGSVAAACQHNANSNVANATVCWQHIAGTTSNSSSTSSGCDSTASSKENYFLSQQQQQQAEKLQQQQQQQQQQQKQRQHYSLTPQQLQQIYYYQCKQQQLLQLLQRQRQRLQQQGVPQPHDGQRGRTAAATKPTTTSAALTCNQQYLLQQRRWQQLRCNNNNNNFKNDNDYLNNNNSNNNNANCNNNNSKPAVRWHFEQGPNLRRGMTEFSTNNDNNHKSHFTTSSSSSSSSTQPLQNSPIHQPYNTKANTNSTPYQPYLRRFNHYNQCSTQHHQHQQHPQPLATFNSNSNNNGNTAASASAHSPLPYKNPLNSPTNLPFSTAHATTAKRYQQQLNDRLLQQQHLQFCQKQQLLSENAAAEELSEESLKQNVAIVLSNLDRYNNALRSIILNEQLSSGTNDSLACSLLDDDNDDDENLLYSNGGGGVDDDNLVGQQRHGVANNNNVLLNANTMAAATPESDYNSNATTPGGRSHELAQPQHGVGVLCAGNIGLGVGGMLNGVGVGVGVGNNLNCSLASSHDFTHDNSDYQWFLDYGYRDGCVGMQRSVLSSLSASYNAMGDLIYYEDLAKNLDANLAEVDMESFRAEDIHSLLSQLPAYCKSLGSTNSRLQQSLLLQQQQQQQQHSNMLQTAQNMSQTSTIDNSFCKSELLFSPVKESQISVDSLDMDAYPDDGDIILTCKANKDNYTIAFEGSVLYSDDSYYEPSEIALRYKQNCINLHSNLEDIVKRNKALEVSMSRSAQAFQPMCAKSPNGYKRAQLERYPSGNNNNTGTETITITRHLPQCSVRKSSSLPNLREPSDAFNGSQLDMQQQQQQQPLNVSQAISTSTIESCKSRNLLPMCQMPISISASITERLHQQQQPQQEQEQDQQQPTLAGPTTATHHPHSHQHRHKHRCSCALSSTNEGQNFCSSSSGYTHKHAHISGSASSGNSNPPAFNLVKLFIKQKSSNCPADDAQASAHTCMDVSSGCWPSSDAAGSSSSSSLEKRQRKKSMNDSGKGSAVSRHEDEYDYAEGELASATVSTPKRQLRTRCETIFYDDGASSSSTGSLTATNSPAHRRRSMPLRNPQLHQLAAASTQTQTQSSQQSSEASNSEQLLTQISSDVKSRRSDAATVRTLSNASSSEMITRSMQTSCGSLSTTRSIERYRCVPPSFLAKLNNLGEERQAPIYVIYPNYALPDLGFVKTNSSSADVIFSPFNYKMTLDSAGASSMTSLKKRSSQSHASDDELLNSLDYNHIADWKSLATLLPAEYRRRLQHIPEVQQMVRQLDVELSQRPLFCMTPPIRRNRPNICDCAKYFQQTQLDEAVSSSGSSQQPSSGYRGSSTLLTDSELDNAAVDPLKQMYVYQYEQQRMDSGVETSPVSRQTPPQPMPRSILRKSHSSQPRSKRNSMIEAQQTQKLSKLEKRRSLQEPPYNYALGSTDELAEVFEEEEMAALPQPTKQRLSRKDLDARARAENFLASLPRSELKYYAEIAAILESSGEQVQYDAAALKKEVSRVLSQQKKVSFNDDTTAALLQQVKRFSTPPNSPNISVAALQRRETLDVQEQRKIESNRFKRLQIQWELMSKDSSMLKELASEQATKSGGSTPTTAAAAGTTPPNSGQRSRIPRPVSYPAGSTPTKSITPSRRAPTSASPKTVTKIHNKHDLVCSPKMHRINVQEACNGKSSNCSPSRIVPPKRYSLNAATTPTSAAAAGAGVGGARARTPTSRAAVTAPSTPKRQSVAQSPRPVSRVR